MQSNVSSRFVFGWTGTLGLNSNLNKLSAIQWKPGAWVEVKYKRKYEEKFEDTRRVIRSHISKDRQHKGQKKKNKKTNNDLQNITQKTKDRAT